jgi:Domain of unknown function (DUF4381)
VTRSGGGRSGRQCLVPLAALIAAAAWSPGADAQIGPGGEPAAEASVVQEHSLDAVRLTLEVEPRELTIDGRVRLTLELAVPADRVAALPDLPHRLGRFAVVAQSSAETSSEGGALRLRRHYELEPEGVGELIVPELVVAVRARTAGSDAVQEIRTDPVPVTVTSVVPEGVDYTEPKDIAPPMSLPQPGWPLWLWAAVGIAAGLLAVALIWRRRRRAAVAARPQPAHLVALAELDHLQAELQRGARADTFYVRLSAILRRHLGWRFGLRALMQTTEEFLAALPGAERALATYRPVLGNLLASFDRVKFARHRPERSDMEAALRRVREFIEGTGDERVLIDPGAARGS